jgi:hypothetical protein
MKTYKVTTYLIEHVENTYFIDASDEKEAQGKVLAGNGKLIDTDVFKHSIDVISCKEIKADV